MRNKTTVDGKEERYAAVFWIQLPRSSRLRGLPDWPKPGMGLLENTTMAVLSVQVKLSGLISDATADIFYTVSFSILGGLVASFGIFTNIINIIVFLKQGFTDSVNVSLFALSLSDLSSLITLGWISLLWNPLFIKTGVPLISREVFHLTGGWPHGFAARTTSWITSYITFERCLCVLIPLKVKRVVTPKLAVSVLVSIFLIHLATLLPDYATAYIGWKFEPTHNRSMLGLLFTNRRAQINVLSFTLAAYTQIISFLSVLFFTAILVAKMKENSKWRASTTNVGHNSQTGVRKRDVRTVNMVILIAVIFSVCYVPTMVSYLTTSLEPAFNIVGRYHNIFLVVWSFTFLADSLNSSVNIFVYYHMSTKYRETCNSVFKKYTNCI